MSYVEMSYAKRCVSTSYAWQWPSRLFFGLAMVLLLPVSQIVAVTPFCGVDTLVDFSDQDGQDSSVDALNDTARLNVDGGAFGAENSSNAELGCRITQQPSGPTKTIFSGILTVGRVKGASNVSKEQVSYYHNEPVGLTMMVFKVGAARANRRMHKHVPSMRERPLAGG